MDRSQGYSLRHRLLARLWIPLFLVVLIGSLGAFWLARHIGSVVYDRWLYDSAMTLAQQVRLDGGKAVLDLPKPAIEMFEWDSVDRIFEEVRSREGRLIFGSAVFPPPPDGLIAGKPRFYEGLVSGYRTKIVAILLDRPTADSVGFVIQVAETKRKRKSIVAEILWFAVPLQVLILLLAGASVWYAVTSGLRTVDNIASHLARYEPDGLVPVADLDRAPTELKPLLNSLNQLIAKLAEAQDTQRRFTANAAHQLRTPLTTLQVQTERALRERDAAKRSEALSHVLTAVRRARHLAHQLLTLARSERSGEPMLRMVTVDLAELAREELEQWADTAIAHHVDLGYDGPERGVTIEAEPLLLRELIGNLVDNAIRYGGAGSVVTLGLKTSPVVLTVDDDGPGIPMEERQMVLERFYRRPGSSGDGCGLGLAIAREIAARHDASVRIRDNPHGRGARIEIVFGA